MKVWTIITVLAVGTAIYFGYGDLLLISAKGLFAYITSDPFIQLIKVLTPLLLPIVTWKLRGKMDQGVSRVVRDKMKIADRREDDIPVEVDKRKYNGKIK